MIWTGGKIWILAITTVETANQNLPRCLNTAESNTRSKMRMLSCKAREHNINGSSSSELTVIFFNHHSWILLQGLLFAQSFTQVPVLGFQGWCLGTPQIPTPTRDTQTQTRQRQKPIAMRRQFWSHEPQPWATTDQVVSKIPSIPCLTVLSPPSFPVKMKKHSREGRSMR